MPEIKPMAANLPGLATHYAVRGDRQTPCGRPTSVAFTSPEWSRVNCKTCLRRRPRVIPAAPSRVES